MRPLRYYLACAILFAGFTGKAVARVTCNGTFAYITASTFTAAMHPGWNPGNTMDAPDGETTWGNPLLVESTFKNVKNIGFNGIRLPGLSLILPWTRHLADWLQSLGRAT
jgi:endoglucanase